MTAVRVQEAAALRIDQIYRYSRQRWGETRAGAFVVTVHARATDDHNRPPPIYSMAAETASQ